MPRDWSAEITAQIIKQIEDSPGKGQMPWHVMASERREMPHNAVTSHQYSGMNTLLLGFAGMGHQTDRWATFKQWKERGRSVAKGQSGYKIIFYKTLEVQDDNAPANDDGEHVRNIPMMRVYTVFNEDQLDDYEAQTPADLIDQTIAVAAADAFVSASGAVICHGGHRAFYSPTDDAITMPERARFTGTDTMDATESYYGVLLHELTHWTGHKSRLDRISNQDRKSYAFEELVAELGAAFLCRKLGVTLEPRLDHAQYLAHWLDMLKGDKRAIFRAAAAAQRAVDVLDALQCPARLAAE